MPAVSVLLQPWFVYDSTAASSAHNTFRVRRAELGLKGSLEGGSRWFLMVDPSKSLKQGAVDTTNDNKILQDLGVAVKPGERWELVAGQMKAPTMAEGLDSSSSLLLPERSMITRNLGDKRQLGVLASVKDTGPHDKWKLSAMISNGGNPNTDDSTNGKDYYLRADMRPGPGLQFGGWVGVPDLSYKNAGDNGRWGVNIRWAGEAGTLRFEHGQYNKTTDGTRKGTHGQVFEAAFYINPKLLPVLRAERFWPDSSKSTRAQAFTLGMNYLLNGHKQKLQGAFSLTKNVSGVGGSLSPDTGTGTGRVFVLCFQAAI